VRLNKYLAQAGVASRRAAEEFIRNGSVRIDGKVVLELGTIVAPDAVVEVSGKRVRPAREHTYVMMHKPAGVMTTMRDPEGRRTIGDVIRAQRGPKAARLVPVGRLDYDTSGVLLLTNDGDLAFALTHPKFGVDKVYRAVMRGRLEPEAVEKLRGGIFLEGRRTAPAMLRVVAVARDRSVVDLTLHEGRYRQVRRMFEIVGHPLVALERLRFGPVTLGALRPAHTRELTPGERKALDALLLNSRTDAGRVKGAGDSRRNASRKRRPRGDTRRN
jgi:23S rRNA pseudouridine2605 synthase